MAKKKNKKEQLIQDAVSVAYWRTRAEDVLVHNEKSALTYENELMDAFQATRQRILDDLDAFYNRYAKNNEISLAEVKQRLDRSAIKSFRMRQKAYIKAVKKIKEGKLSDAYINRAKELGAKAYVSKVDELVAKIDYELENLAINQMKGMTKALKTGYKDAYETTAKNLNEGLNVNVTFSGLTNKRLSQAVQTEWLGENFSSRIWQSKDKLLRNLKQLLPQEFVRGRGPKQVARDLADRMNVTYSNAERLIRTEMNYINNQAALDTFTDAGIKKFIFEAILDERTSAICQEMNGQIFDISEAESGVNVPPLHPNCRSTIEPWFEQIEASGDYDITDQVG